MAKDLFAVITLIFYVGIAALRTSPNSTPLLFVFVRWTTDGAIIMVAIFIVCLIVPTAFACKLVAAFAKFVYCFF